MIRETELSRWCNGSI